MIRFSTTILKFGKKGEKTGWSYIEFSAAQSEKLKPGTRVSFRIRGTLDKLSIQKIAIIPMGDGTFILPLNATLRKKLGKEADDKLLVQVEADERARQLSSDFVKCLKDEPRAWEHFNTLPKSHQHYFSNWIESAKTIQTKSKRIAMAVMALAQKMGYGEMIRANKNQR